MCTFLNVKGDAAFTVSDLDFAGCFLLEEFMKNQGFQYFLQVHECTMEPKSKMKINKWLGIPDIRRYETFVTEWHYFLKKVEKF